MPWLMVVSVKPTANGNAAADLFGITGHRPIRIAGAVRHSSQRYQADRDRQEVDQKRNLPAEDEERADNRRHENAEHLAER